MRVSVLVFAILGGVFGMFMGLIAMAVGGIGNSVSEGSGNEFVGLGISAIAAAVVGIAVGVLHFSGKRRTLMASLLVVVTIWHLVSISYFAIPGTIFFALAALFAFLSRKGPTPALSYPPQFAPQFAGPMQGFMAAQPKLPPAAFCASCGQPGQERGKFCGACGAVVP